MNGVLRVAVPDFEKAIEWYKKAAEQGDSTAQFIFWNPYYFGQGTPKDDKQAVYWYQKAAKQGDPRAQYNLGAAYHFGDGIKQDDSLAAYWLK